MASRFTACLTISALALGLSAQDPERAWRIGGFGTLGLAANSSRESEFSRDLSQPRGAGRDPDGRVDSRLGLQANWTLNEEFSLVGQAVSRYRYDHTFTPELTWAFLKYASSSGLQVRLGRLGLDVFQLADSRNVGYAYLWVRPPVEFYGPLLVSYLDGADAAWSTALAQGRTLRLKLSAGRAAEKVPLGSGGTYLDLRGSRLLGAACEFQAGDLDLRLTHARMRTAHDFPSPVRDLREGLEAFAGLLGDPGLASQAADLGFRDRSFSYTSAGLNWRGRLLRVEAAGAHVDSDSPLVPDFRTAYLSLSRRHGAFEPYLLVARVVSRHPEPYLGALPESGPEGAALAAGLVDLMSNLRMNQTSIGVGFRWDLRPGMALKLQVDRIATVPEWSFLWANADPAWNGRATVASAVLDFVF